MPAVRKSSGGACATTHAGGIPGAILWLLMFLKPRLQLHWLKSHSYPRRVHFPGGQSRRISKGNANNTVFKGNGIRVIVDNKSGNVITVTKG